MYASVDSNYKLILGIWYHSSKLSLYSETIAGYELHIHLREKTDVEILSERVDALEDSHGTQDEAIDDLGGAVSDLMEE